MPPEEPKPINISENDADIDVNEDIQHPPLHTASPLYRVEDLYKPDDAKTEIPRLLEVVIPEQLFVVVFGRMGPLQHPDVCPKLYTKPMWPDGVHKCGSPRRYIRDLQNDKMPEKFIAYYYHIPGTAWNMDSGLDVCRVLKGTSPYWERRITLCRSKLCSLSLLIVWIVPRTSQIVNHIPPAS